MAAECLPGGFDAEWLIYWLHNMVLPNGFVIAAMDEEGEFRGAIAASLTNRPYSPEKIAVETFLFTDNRYRGKGISKLLRHEAERMSAARGATVFLMTVLSGGSQIAKHLKKDGYLPAECHFTKDLTGFEEYNEHGEEALPEGAEQRG